MHQRWKRTWLGWAGIYPTTRVSVTSPNPGEQAWYLQKERLPDRPSVISLGLAENLSFDLAMVRAYRSIVHGFDPTEASQAWVANHSLPEDFHFHSLAVAGYDGWIELVERRGRGGRIPGPVFQRAPCRRLSGILRELPCRRVDVLKMDIEGSEYGVLDDILSAGIFPTQIAVEFHHRFKEVGLPTTRRAHQALRRHGYDLAHISPWAEEFLYVQRDFA